MTPELRAFHDRAIAAESVGDVEEALAYHRGIPMFRQSRHSRLLEQLATVKTDLPPWVHARWIVYQSIRCEERGSRSARLVRAAVRDSVEAFHADLMDTAYAEGDDPVRVVARVMGESWAYHQLAAHDHGALQTFVDEFVGGKLAEHAPLALSWVGTRMGGYRIEGRGSPCALTVRDLADSSVAEVLDLGAGCLAAPNGTVIGRLVPSGTTPAWMFDTAPLPVDDHLATHVARAGRESEWAEVIADAIEGGGLDPGCLLREDYELLSDIPSLDLLAFGTQPTDLARVIDQLRDGRDEVGRAAFRVLRKASDGALGDEAAPYVAAAVLNVHALEQARRRILARGQRSRWLHWAELSPDPARSRLLAFAEATFDAA